MEENNNIQQEKTVVKKKTSICGQLSLFLSFFVCTGLNIYSYYLIELSGSSDTELGRRIKDFDTDAMLKYVDNIKLAKILSVAAAALAVVSIVLSIINFTKKDRKKRRCCCGTSVLYIKYSDRLIPWLFCV